MNVHKKLVLGAVLLVVSIFASLYLYQLEKDRQREVSQAGTEVVSPEPMVSDQPEVEKIDASIYTYRINSSKPGDPRFAMATRGITADTDSVQQAKEIVTAVLDGSRRVLPASARLLELYLLEDGTAVVDLSGDVSRGLAGSVEVELGIVESITRSLRRNLSEIRQVKFLVEGQEQPTLAGHVSIQVPFR